MPLRLIIFSIFLVMASFPGHIYAQDYIEPDILPSDESKSPADFGLYNGATFNLMVTNNGFAVGGQYRRVVSRFSEVVFEAQISALKDSREQAFFSIWGQQIIPNKYNRVLTFPVLGGLRQRLFADYISDNFRIFIQASAGPALTFVYPYFNDVLFSTQNFPSAGENADNLPLGVRINDIQINDVFQGWADGEWILGGTAKTSLSIDFGNSFRSLTSVEFGVQMFYYPDGIQVLEPNRLVVNQGVISDRIIGEGFSAERWFITPTVTLMFGGMW